MKGDAALCTPHPRDEPGMEGPPFHVTRTPSVHRARRSRRDGWGKGSHLSAASGLSENAEAPEGAPGAPKGGPHTPSSPPPSHRNFSLECSLSLGSEGLAHTDDEAHTAREGSDSQGNNPGARCSDNNIKGVNTSGPARAPSRQLRSRSSRRSTGSAFTTLDSASENHQQQHQQHHHQRHASGKAQQQPRPEPPAPAAGAPQQQPPHVSTFLQFLPPTPSGSPAPSPMILASPPLGATAQAGAAAGQPGTPGPTTVLLPKGLNWGSITDNPNGNPTPGLEASQTPAGILPMVSSALFSGAGLPGVGPVAPSCVMLDSRMVLPPGSPAAAAAAAAMAGRAGFSLVLPYAQNRRVASKGKGPGTGRRACGCPARMCKCGACPPKPTNARRQKGKGPGTGRRACGCPSRRCSCGAAALLSLPQIPVLVPLVMDPSQPQPQQTPGIHLIPGFGPGHPPPSPGQPGQMALCATKDGYILTPLPAGHATPQSATSPIVMPAGLQAETLRKEPGCEDAKDGSGGDLCTDLRLGSPGNSWASGVPLRGSQQRQQPGQQPKQQHAASPTVSSTSKLWEDEEEERGQGPAAASVGEGGDCARPLWMRQVATQAGGPHPRNTRRDVACEAKGKRLLFESGAAQEGGPTTLGPTASDSEVVVGPMSARAPTPTARGTPRGSLSLSPSSSDSSDEKEAPSGSLLTDASAFGLLKRRPQPSPSRSHSLSHSHFYSPSQPSHQNRQHKERRGGHTLSAAPAAVEVSHLQSRIRWELRSLARALSQQSSALEAPAHSGLGSGDAKGASQLGHPSPMRLSSPLQPSPGSVSAAAQCGARTRSLLLQLHRLSCIPNDCGDASACPREAAPETAISPQAVFASCKLRAQGLGSPPAVRCSGMCGRTFHPECLLPCGSSGASSTSAGASSNPSSMVTEGLQGPMARASPTGSSDEGEFPGTPLAGKGTPGVLHSKSGGAPSPPLQGPQPPLLCHACRCWADVFRAVLDLLPLPPSARGSRPRMTSSSSCSNMLAAAGRASEAAAAAAVPSWTWQDIMPPAVMEQWALWARDVLGPAAAAGVPLAEDAGGSEAGGVPLGASGSGSGVVTLTGNIVGLGMGEESGLVEDEELAALRAGKDEVLGDEDEDMEEGEGEAEGGEKMRSLSLDRGVGAGAGVGVFLGRGPCTPLGTSRALQERQGCSCSGGSAGACPGCDSDGSSLYETLLEGVRLMCRAHAQALALGEATPSPGSSPESTAAAFAGTSVEGTSAAAAGTGAVGVAAYRRCAAALVCPESPLATPHSSTVAWELAPPSIPPTPPLHGLASPGHLSGGSQPPRSVLDPDAVSMRDGGMNWGPGASRDGAAKACKAVPGGAEASRGCAQEAHTQREAGAQAPRLGVPEAGPATPDTKMQTRSSTTSAVGAGGPHTGARHSGLRPLAIPPMALGALPGAGAAAGESSHGTPLETPRFSGMLCLNQGPAGLTSIPASPAAGGVPAAPGGQAQTVLFLAMGSAEALGSAAGAPGGPHTLCSATGVSEGGARQQIAVMPVHLGESLTGAAGEALKRGAGGAPDAGNVGYFYCYYVQNGDAVTVAAAAAAAAAAAGGASGEQCGEQSRKRRRKQFQPRSTAQLEVAC